RSGAVTATCCSSTSRAPAPSAAASWRSGRIRRHLTLAARIPICRMRRCRDPIRAKVNEGMLTRRTWLMLGAAVLTAAAAGAVLLLWGGPDALNAQTCREPVPLRFETASKITRSELGFTQGLEVRDGQLYESTGRVGGTTRINTISFTGQTPGQVRTLTDLG